MEKDLRLNKELALRAGISRREADELIEQGRVRVNQQKALLGQRITEGDVLSIDNHELYQQSYTYIAFHKPVGYVCSRKQQGDNPTIYSLLPQEYHTLKPVGRLDKDSSGIILLTNDGDFAHQMTHPSFHKTKVYEVKLDKPLEPLHQQMISDYGVQLEDGTSKFLVQREDDMYKITMHEGRNRQIRRTFSALGYTVTKLHRVQFGKYSLKNLATGAYQNLTI